MDLLAQGLTGEQVAERLFLSPETIKTHIRNAMNKLEANTRVHAIAIALREGFISAPTGLVNDDDLVLDGETHRKLRHDLRTPLTIVAGFAEVLAGDREISHADPREFAARIQDAAGDIRRLIDQALDSDGPPAEDGDRGARRRTAAPASPAARSCRPARRSAAGR